MNRILPATASLYNAYEECLNMKKITRRSFLAAAGPDRLRWFLFQRGFLCGKLCCRFF